ncbi:MAG: hypothetical protein KC502_14850 [Myxococcales bacterium]|nr:hypothetical protein [Myxococcales bacterium]
MRLAFTGKTALLAIAICALGVSTASAAVPTTSTIEGALTSAGGGAAADGSYAMTFSIYAAQGAKTPAWQEAGVKVSVKGGRFSYALGTTKALSPKTLGALGQAWLGVRIGNDPELPRQRIRSTPYALVAHQAKSLSCSGCVSGTSIANGGVSASKVGFNFAGSSTKGGPAKDLACTACVSVKELKFDGNVNLGAYSIKAKNGTFTGGVAAATVTATSFIGNGSKLTGLKMPKGACTKAGEVVKGINADGTLQCVKAMDPAALPADGLNEISNNLLSNQFIDTVSATTKKVPIPDATGSNGVSNISFPNIGIAQKIWVYVHVENTDLSNLSLVVLPPNDKSKGWTLCDPCGGKDAKVYKKTFTPTAKPKSGDIGYWIGKNPKGLWNLKALDVKFCVPQANLNNKYCSVTKKTDGWITDWYIRIQTLSNQKVAVNGNQYVGANQFVAKGLKIGFQSTCNATYKGMLRWHATYGLQVCNGADWSAAKSKPIVYQGYCSQSRRYSSTFNYFCLDKTELNTAGDYFTVSTFRPPSGTSSSTSYDKYWHTNNYKTGRVTFKKAGYYRVLYKNYCRAYTYCYTRILRNGSVFKYTYDSEANAYQYMSQNTQVTLYMNKGQYLEFQARVNTDNSTAYAILGGSQTSYVNIEYLGQNF